MIVSALLVLAAAPLTPARAAEIDPYLPDDSEFLMTLNVRQILDSALVKKYALEKVKTALARDDMQKVLKSLDFDPITDLASIAIAGPGSDDPEKGLIILRGKFNVEKLQARVEEEIKSGAPVKVHQAGSHKIYEIKAEGLPPNLSVEKIFGAVVDNQTIVVSPKKDYVSDVLDKKRGKKKSSLTKQMKGLIEKADGRQSLWVAALVSGLGKNPLTDDDKVKDVLDKFDSFSGGITLTGDVTLELALAAKNADAAGDLKKVLADGLVQAKGAVAILSLQSQNLAPLTDIVETIKIAGQGNAVTLQGKVAADLIEKMLK